MPEIKKDLLNLQYSENFEIQGIQEANIDLELTPSTPSTGTVYGVVGDGVNPIPNATVKLFDSKGMPYKHTITDVDGSYSMTDIPAGTYSLGAVKEGYLLSDAAGVTLADGVTTKIDLVCTQDTTLSLGAIAGVLTIKDPLDGSSKPLAGAKISLQNATGETLAATYTAEDGEFAFYDLIDGVYTLISSADGYKQTSTMTATILAGSIVNLTMTMAVDTKTYNGTVSGIIRNKSGQAVAGCFVGLYQIIKIGEVSQEQLVAVTKTNAEGKYLFGEVLGGQYLVKAKLEQ